MTPTLVKSAPVPPAIPKSLYKISFMPPPAGLIAASLKSKNPGESVDTLNLREEQVDEITSIKNLSSPPAVKSKFPNPKRPGFPSIPSYVATPDPVVDAPDTKSKTPEPIVIVVVPVQICVNLNSLSTPTIPEPDTKPKAVPASVLLSDWEVVKSSITIANAS